MAERKIALFGGTFDPIHLGHTTVAADASEHIGAEKIVFVPAKRSPLKGFLPRANDNHRLKMISLAIAGEKNFRVSDYELKRPAPSYTLATIRKFQADYGSGTSIHWLIGADGVDDLAYWYKITELIDACNLTTMYRAGCEPPDFAKFEKTWGRKRIEKLQRNIIQTPLVDISSTEIRNRIAKNGDITKMLHPAVADYIRKNGLYQSKDTAGGG
ncbi:MAG: nicotinate (nicotinamide) nucleotide adenylyltransferase [Planctomycetes bacterium RBG_13_50_24]|nr:MAG: nicotinate (nicotinamide) nucleotide adenylyltransferase [Planctomycetes bacterium RBG_13_50_24]